ncbi:disease resistance protein RPV1 isoform X1 [Cryptomeria japonica]|uniref:disease resistance protein RPV1 isoform X1 n=1 Tax=Cryptomeria japonica TaxID=3369 RepID=UPI0027DA5EDA|nr:disease resistance protein RPV1 isoform X1 [Cryptomeria japonica]
MKEISWMKVRVRKVRHLHQVRRLESFFQISYFCLKFTIFKRKPSSKRNGIRGIKAVALENKELLYKEELLLLAPSLVGLKLLAIRGDYFKQVIGEVPRELVWLCWFNIGQRSLPTWLSLKNLRVLQLSEHFGRQEHHLEELWKAESDAPLQLRELVIANCYKFQRFPNSIGCLSELKKIVITGHGNNIRSLPEEFCHLQFLEHLELQWCEMLSLLPSNFGNLRNLRYLDLSRCTELKSLPVSFKNLILLQYLNLEMCRKLILRSDDLQNITKLEFLSLFRCEQLEELPHHITNQVSLRELYLGGGKMLRELPIEIGRLSRLRKMRIGGHFISLPNSLGDLSSLAYLSICDSTNLESLPTSLGDLSSLTNLSIQYCDNLESLPTSLGDLSLTNLAICGCSKLKCLPSSIGHLNHLEHLEISECSISQVDFGAASLSFALNNLKWMELKQTEVCRISISDDCFPCLQTLELDRNYQLTEIRALPVKLEWLHIKSCPQLDVLPSFAQLTCLREFDVEGCDRIEKIDGFEDCTKLEILRLHTCSEVPSIESLEQMKELRQVELKANKGSAIENCIQTIKKWPDGIIICTPAIPDASSLVDSFKCGLSPDLFVVDSFSNKDILCTSILQEKHTSNGNAIMVGFVVNNVSARQLKIALFHDDNTCGSIISEMGTGEGRWALIGVFTQRSRWNSGKDLFSLCTLDHDLHVEVKAEVERGSAVRGEEQRLVEASLRLLHSICM